METDLISNGTINGNVKALRNMWSIKAQEQQTSSQPRSKQQKLSSKNSIPTFKITHETIQNKSSISSNNEETLSCQSVKKLSSLDQRISLPITAATPPPPKTTAVIFKHQVQTVSTLKQSIKQMTTNVKKNIPPKNSKHNGNRLWHVTRHVFHSGFILNRRRRASDSILPLLMKKYLVKQQSHRDSIDSTLSAKPFEDFIDYLAYDKENSVKISQRIKRTKSDISDCMRSNTLDDTILQYEMILQRVKNYEQFMTMYPKTTPPILRQREKSVDNDLINTGKLTKEKLLSKSPISIRQTQSLSRNMGHTFSNFLMNDLMLSPTPKSQMNVQQTLSLSHASSQTDLYEPAPNNNKEETNDSTKIIKNDEIESFNSISNEEVKEVLNEFDTMLVQELPRTPDTDANVIVQEPPSTTPSTDVIVQEVPVTPNIEVNVVVQDIPRLPKPEAPLTAAQLLMKRLFEGKKSAYSPSDLNMELNRLSEELIPVYEIAKERCFFETETPVYVSKMFKIRRRSYTQHLRILCITTQRLYNITKKNPYPKEALLYNSIIGVTCTPYKDGFVCIQTKETHDDRGDWLVLVDHPCEFITQLFMIMKRDHNNDGFLKIKTEFTHCRRFYGELSSSLCMVEAHIADAFRIKKLDFETVAIYTP